MNNDLLKPISQGSIGAQDAENQRITEITNEFVRFCSVYAQKCGKSSDNVTALDMEMRVAEAYAKEHAIWIPMDKIFALGEPGPSGNENDTYVNEDYVFKVNNLMNCGSILSLFDKIKMHNEIFPDTFYVLYGFTGFEGRTIMPVLRQNRVANAQPATQIIIDTYMAAIGFSKREEVGKYSNVDYTVWDLLPRNVLYDKDGDIYVVDAEISRNSL